VIGSDKPMTILEHLAELRARLVKAVIALLVGMVLGAFLTEPVLRQLVAPLGDQKPYAGSPIATTSAFFQIAAVIGLVLAMPVIMYQLFRYISPGLTPNERRYAITAAPIAALCFGAGAAFATYVILPAAIPFLSGFLEDVVAGIYTIQEYLSFVSSVMIAAGLVFETPLVMYVLAKLGVVTPSGFASGRRVVLVGAAIGAAVITPTPDPLNMMLVMGPFVLLYELGILLAKLAVRGRELD
jgi:sec-independent protein translocase protein TatC